MEILLRLVFWAQEGPVAIFSFDFRFAWDGSLHIRSIRRRWETLDCLLHEVGVSCRYKTIIDVHGMCEEV